MKPATGGDFPPPYNARHATPRMRTARMRSPAVAVLRGREERLPVSALPRSQPSRVPNRRPCGLVSIRTATVRERFKQSRDHKEAIQTEPRPSGSDSNRTATIRKRFNPNRDRQGAIRNRGHANVQPPARLRAVPLRRLPRPLRHATNHGVRNYWDCSLCRVGRLCRCNVNETAIDKSGSVWPALHGSRHNGFET